MEFKMVKGSMTHIEDCADALINSELGQQYFYTKDKAINAIVEGLKKEEILVAVDTEGKSIGFIWYILEGAFHAYPHLHIIALKTSIGL